MSSISAVGSIGWLVSPQFITTTPVPPAPPSIFSPASELQPPTPAAPASRASREIETVANARRMMVAPVFCPLMSEPGQRSRAPVGFAEGAIGNAHRIENGDEQVVVRHALAVVGEVAPGAQRAARTARQHIGRADAAVGVALRQ